jgi:protein gp37
LTPSRFSKEKASDAVAAETDIQWCDSSVNPVMGCQTCELWTPTRKTCYAGALHQLRRGRPGYAKRFEVPELFPGRMKKAAGWEDLTGLRRLQKPWLDASPRLIFVSDMGDALSATVPFTYLETEVIELVTTPRGRRHRWLWLTKQPAQASKFSKWLRGLHIPWPSNLWIGTSVTTQSKVDRVRHLLDVGDEAACSSSEGRSLDFKSEDEQGSQRTERAQTKCR